jgi:hypothetical protein
VKRSEEEEEEEDEEEGVGGAGIYTFKVLCVNLSMCDIPFDPCTL